MKMTLKMALRSMMLIAGLAVASPMMAHAQQVPGPHPAYLHALSDLRGAPLPE
jgi:hypothetical protein